VTLFSCEAYHNALLLVEWGRGTTYSPARWQRAYIARMYRDSEGRHVITALEWHASQAEAHTIFADEAAK
jgi:hypothetical protein